MFSTFCLRLAAGLAASLLLLPRGVVQPRFYRIHLLIALGLAVAAALSAEVSADYPLFWLIIGFGIGSLFVASGIWLIDGLPGRTASLVATTALLVLGVLTLSAETAPAIHTYTPLAPHIWHKLGLPVADELTSTLVLGLAATAMLLGHWYLISPTMSIQPLMRLLNVLFLCLLFRGVVSAAVFHDLYYTGFVPTLFDREDWIWPAHRWITGWAFPLGLLIMAWFCARIRSTQSATGILYVVLALALVGELTEMNLQAHLKSLSGIIICT